MAKEPARVTVNQRILVHLLGYVRATDLDAVPPAVTQQGIADLLRVRRSHVSLALQALHRRGLVEDRTARVVGGVRRKKSYALTPLGYARAREAQSDVHARTFATDREREPRLPGAPAEALG